MRLGKDFLRGIRGFANDKCHDMKPYFLTRVSGGGRKSFTAVEWKIAQDSCGMFRTLRMSTAPS